jgi:hypothetical protein
MKVKFIGTALFTLFMSNIAVAQSEEAAPSPGGKSQSNRAGKKAYVAYDVIGLTLMPVSGARVGYFIDQDLVAEAGFSSGGASIGDFKADKSIIELKAKKFFGNSFYVDGGLGYELWNVNYPVSISDTSSETRKLKGTVQNTGLEFHIGNQWQWDGFTLGCDWLGYFLSLSSSTSFKSDSSVSAQKKEEEEKDVKKTFVGSSAHITRLYLGWAF